MSLDLAQQHVRAFHQVFNQTVGLTPAVRDAALRARLINEEALETTIALEAGDLVGISDGLCDLIYVAIGTAVACGIDLSPLFTAVHVSNMAKVGGKLDAGGKLQKPPGWLPPDIAGELEKQGWKPTDTDGGI